MERATKGVLGLPPLARMYGSAALEYAASAISPRNPDGNDAVEDGKAVKAPSKIQTMDTQDQEIFAAATSDESEWRYSEECGTSNYATLDDRANSNVGEEEGTATGSRSGSGAVAREGVDTSVTVESCIRQAGDRGRELGTAVATDDVHDASLVRTLMLSNFGEAPVILKVSQRLPLSDNVPRGKRRYSPSSINSVHSVPRSCRHQR